MNIIVIISFDYGDDNRFSILHEVLLKSIKKNVSNAEIISHHLQEPEMKFNRTRSFISNSIKLRKWTEEIRKCGKGDNVVLMDADMLILGDPFKAFKEDFDIGYTKRTNSKWPLNGGVVFIKVDKWTKTFMNTWLKNNDIMLEDLEFHKKWQQKYAGINQASFGYMIENFGFLFKLNPFPCKIYNACGEDLPDFDENVTKILHVKGKLRQAIFGEIETEPELQYPVSIWNEYKELL
jgi:hypothetical protein